MRTITIEVRDDKEIDVIENGKSTGPMAWDEAMGVVTELMHPKLGKTRIAMRTQDEWIEWQAFVSSRRSPPDANEPREKTPY